MNQILSHQHISVPVWTNSRLPDYYRSAPDMLVHVQVTVIRTRYRSVFKYVDDDRDHAYEPQRLRSRPGTNGKLSPAQTSANEPGQTRIPSAAPPRKPVIRDPRVNDPKFLEKYTLN